MVREDLFDNDNKDNRESDNEDNVNEDNVNEDNVNEDNDNDMHGIVSRTFLEHLIMLQGQDKLKRRKYN